MVQQYSYIPSRWVPPLRGLAMRTKWTYTVDIGAADIEPRPHLPKPLLFNTYLFCFGLATTPSIPKGFFQLFPLVLLWLVFLSWLSLWWEMLMRLQTIDTLRGCIESSPPVLSWLLHTMFDILKKDVLESGWYPFCVCGPFLALYSGGLRKKQPWFTKFRGIHVS